MEDGEEVLSLSSTAPVAQLVDPAELRGVAQRKQSTATATEEGVGPAR
ncbi:hypothetical protein ACFW4X_19700 [Streptomyces smyrnaeus]